MTLLVAVQGFAAIKNYTADGDTSTKLPTDRRIYRGDCDPGAATPNAGDDALLADDQCSCTPGVNCPTKVTDANGQYLFNGLSNGTYTVAVISGVPAAYNLTFDFDGVGTPNVATATVTGNQTQLALDFGYQPAGYGQHWGPGLRRQG